MIQKIRLPQEIGQTAVMFALMMIGLVAFVGLAVDGGNVLNERRITQNAADASALTGVRYMATSDNPTEQNLQIAIHNVVEANGLPDSNDNPEDAVNDFVVAYYTDERGNRLVSPNCSLVGTCGGSIPNPAQGLEVQVTNIADTYFLGIIGQRTANIGADAVAVARGLNSGGVGDLGILATGQCPQEPDEHYELTSRGNNNEIIGGMHANASFESSGNGNHFHGQVSSHYDPPKENGVYEPDPPGEPVYGDIIADPFATWMHEDFAPESTKQFIIDAKAAGQYYDVRTLDRASGGQPGIIEQSELREMQVNPNGYPPLFNSDNRNSIDSDGITLGPLEFRPGIYYAGELEINLGENGAHGTITVVGGHLIKTSGNEMNLTSYLDLDSGYPGLLFFSDYALPDHPACDFEEAGNEPIIKMTGKGGNGAANRFEVYHDLPDCPYPKIDGCYKPSNNLYTGLIYAQNGRVKTADGNTTYIGAIVGFSVDFSEANLYVVNGNLYPESDPMIFLER